MTDAVYKGGDAPRASVRRDIGIKKRYAAEQRFRMYGIIAIAIGQPSEYAAFHISCQGLRQPF